MKNALKIVTLVVPLDRNATRMLNFDDCKSASKSELKPFDQNIMKNDQRFAKKSIYLHLSQTVFR